MDFFEIIETRRSVRLFNDRPIEEIKLHKVLNAANRAPSAGNLQAFEIFVVRDIEHKKSLAKAAFDQSFISDAGIVLVFCAHPSRSGWRYSDRGMNLYCIQDATISCTFAMLACTALGLASVWIGAFDENHVKIILDTDQDLKPVAMLPIGYAGEEPDPISRRKLSEIVHEVNHG